MVKFTSLDVEVVAMKAVKYDPDPSGVAQVQKPWVLPPGSDLTAFLFFESKQYNGLAPLLFSPELLNEHCFM